MNKTVILAIAVLTGLLILGFNFDEVFSVERPPSGPVPMPYPVTTKAIPSWVDNNFRWYIDGQIDEATLLTSMNWMFDNNVMHLSEKAAQEVADLRDENNRLKQQIQEENAILNPAQQKDQEEMERYFEAERKKLEAQIEALEEAASSSQDETDDTRSETKITQQKSTTAIEPTLKQPIQSVLTAELLKPLEDEIDSMMAEFLKLQTDLESVEAETLDISNELQGNLDAKVALEETITEIREMMTRAYGSWPVKVSYYDENDDVVSVILSSPDDAQALIDELEARLDTMSDDTQMMQLELQDAMQKQQQMMQTLSAIMKSQHDTLKAIISNMR